MLEPTRRGRFADIGDWQRQYAALLTTAEEAAAWVRDGDVLVMSASANWPYAFDAALTKHLRAIGGRVEVNGLFLPLDTCLMAAENKDLVTFHSNFFSGERVLAPQGNIQFVPTHLSATGDWQASRHPRVAVITCSAPNEQGWMSRSLWGSDVSRRALEQAEVVIVEINDQLPFFASDGEAHMLFHVSEADILLENSRPVAETPPVPEYWRGPMLSAFTWPVRSISMALLMDTTLSFRAMFRGSLVHWISFWQKAGLSRAKSHSRLSPMK